MNLVTVRDIYKNRENYLNKEIEVGGFDEEDCMTRLISMIDEHGDLVWYSGVSDEDYVAGEYIGRENFIYD